jgi:8-oxo-dGTP diphosphatase
MSNYDAIFGKKIDGETYDTREGVYGILLRDNKIGVIKTSTGYFLPGGGIENNESHSQCLEREFLEETGYAIDILDYIGRASKFHFSNIYFRHRYLIGNFYFVDLKDKIADKIEEDHELLWLKYDEALSKLYLENQKWAVERAISINKN